MHKTYYIKPQKGDIAQAISSALANALNLIKQKNYKNIKIVIGNMGLIKDPPNYISQGFHKVLNGDSEAIVKKLSKERAISIPNFPKDGIATGINLLLLGNVKSSIAIDEETVVILIFADADSFRKVHGLQSITSKKPDLIAVLFSEDNEINEQLSAANAENLSSVADPNVQNYVNNFPQAIKDILAIVNGINLSEVPSHNPTRDAMDRVFKNLKDGGHTVTHSQLLGYLVNEVHYNMDDSIELLKRGNKYFG